MNTTMISGLAFLLALFASPVVAQDHDHHEAAVAEPVEEVEEVEEIDHAAMGHGAPTEPVEKVEEVDHAAMGHDVPAAPVEEVDHSAMGHDVPAAPVEEVDHSAMGHDVPSKPVEAVDHAAMGHDVPAEQVEEVDHAAMGHDVPVAPVEEADHSAMGHDVPSKPVETVDHAAMGHGAPVSPQTPVPPVTAADRAAAVKPPGGHPAHDNGVFQFVLFDRLESAWSDGERSQAWEIEAWRGTDLNRLWLRSEGERAHGDTEHANVEVLYGRSVSPWWDVVGGVRHDFGEGPSQTMAAFGVQGLAPYKYEFAATAYLGQSGQSALNLEAEYDTLLTNRLILQWHAEAEFWGRDDPERGIGSGLNSVEAGLRLRYEIRREFAPYVGVVWERRFGDAADAVELEGGDESEARVVAGFRFWF